MQLMLMMKFVPYIIYHIPYIIYPISYTIYHISGILAMRSPLMIRPRLYEDPLGERKLIKTRSSWLNCALRDDESVYWVSTGHYEAVAVGN